MKRIDALNLAHPFAGSRLRDLLNREGLEVGRRHVATLMRRREIEALYRKPNTSKKHPTHKIYAYLLRGLEIDRANQVWASDITYIPNGQRLGPPVCDRRLGELGHSAPGIDTAASNLNCNTSSPYEVEQWQNERSTSN